MTIKEFKNSADFKTWKSSIVRRRLEKLDELLSSGEWISNSRMIKEINELYLEAPNDDIYGSSAVPHKIIESKELSKEKYESVLYMTYAGTIRQDRLAINKILRIVGKEHIFERKDDGKGTEGSYRYNTPYSIFDKYTINEIEFDDYEFSQSIPYFPEAIKLKPKTKCQKESPTASHAHNLFGVTKKDTYLIDVVNNVGDLTISTISTINLLTAISQALQRAQTINKERISTLSKRAYAICLANKKGWVKEVYKIQKNIYTLATHPDADIDIELLFSYRYLYAYLRIFNEPDTVLLSLWREEYNDLQRPEIAPIAPHYEDTITAALKHFVFDFRDYDGMLYELEKHYEYCICSNTIIEDYSLMEAFHYFIYQDLYNHWEEHRPNDNLYKCLNKIINLYYSSQEKNEYISWMLLLFDFARKYSMVTDVIQTSSFTELYDQKLFLLTAIKHDSISSLIQENAHRIQFFQMAIDQDFEEKTSTVEYMVLLGMVSDMFDLLSSLFEDNASMLEPLPTLETQTFFEVLLSRLTKLNKDDILGRPEDSPIMKCKLALGIINETEDRDEKALAYYLSVKEMHENGYLEIPDEVLEFVNNRIDVLSSL